MEYNDNQPRASLIIAFYNNIELLELVFKALNEQTEKNFELVIADDGSKKEVVDHIKNRIENLPFPVQHVWHEDKGFRKNRILNKAVIASKSDYLIFLDGDCIPEAHFVEDHLSESSRGYALNGRRVDLSEKYSRLLKSHKNPATFFTEFKWSILKDYIFSGGGQKEKGRNIEKGFRILNPTLRRMIIPKDKGLVGCNFSLFKDDLLKINGFDMRYEAPGVGEDSDLDYRWLLAGFKKNSLFYKATQLHCYHPILERSSKNDDIYNAMKSQNSPKAQLGIQELKREK
ncbi:glycosyltransferase [Vibrio sp. S9_S30]|uniref:glycosyltransferase n=1 Tax=Vibrio sp. S9_S30 TaxID=2720226 RepID=UPI001681A79B|nr:glycosyltransferase [Vibrio sp. S9_S30]MBD1558504.1 glycosyltransferase [Vibrio sp. S9_S30]